MVNSDSKLNALIEPLLARSSRNPTPSKYIDDAADLVLKRLGVDADIAAGAPQDWAKKNQLTWWTDEKAHRFFNTRPSALGVEVNCGISTRFHRISGRADWPRFSWLMVNPAGVNECLQQAFPEMDNFTIVASDTPESAWLNLAIQQNGDAALVIIGESEPLSEAQLAKLVGHINQANLGKLQTLELVVFHTVDELTPLVKQSHYPMTIKDQCNSQPHSSILTRLFQTKEQLLNAAHIMIQVSHPEQGLV